MGSDGSLLSLFWVRRTRWCSENRNTDCGASNFGHKQRGRGREEEFLHCQRVVIPDHYDRKESVKGRHLDHGKSNQVERE